jgi:hypothetical protein
MANPWDEWLDAYRAKQAEKSEAGRQAKAAQAKLPKVYRPITADELRKIKRLQKVSTAWWAGDRRFINQLEKATAETQITDGQGEFIEILWYKYRRQLGHDDPRPEFYEGRR